MAELADIQAEESQGIVENAPIPAETTPVETKAEKPPTLRQTLEKSIETVREAEAKADKAGRLHGEGGKFVPKDKPEVAPKEAAPAVIPEIKKDAQPAQASAPVGPPPGWSTESKAAFEALPASVKADVLKRETEISTGFKQKSDELKRYSDIEQVLAPLRPVFQQAGIASDAEAIRSLVSWEGRFRNPQTRIQAFHGLAQQYGINLSQLAQSPDPPMAQEIPAQLRPVLDQFGQMSQELSSIKSEFQRSREAEVSTKLSAFAKDKPHFEKVRVAMGQLMQVGMVQPDDLDGAYQQAIWANPEIRAELQKEATEKAAAELAKANAAKSQNAQRAAISPGTRAPSGPAINGKGTAKGVKGSLMAAIRELQDERA